MNKKWKTAAIALLCTIAVLSTGYSAITLHRVRQLENQVLRVQQMVTGIDSDIKSTLNSAITTITESAQETASIVSDYQVKWGECNHDDKTMQMTVRIMPKEYSDSTQVRVRCGGYSARGQDYDMVFDCEGFEERSAEAVRVESGVYEADMTIPLANYVSLAAEVQDENGIQQQKLDDQYGAWNLKLLHPQMEGGFRTLSTTASNKTAINYTGYASVYLMTSYDAGGVSQEPEMVGGSITMYLNNEKVLTKDLNETEQADSGETKKTDDSELAQERVISASGDVYHAWNSDSNAQFEWEDKLSGLKDGDEVRFVMRIQDENGFTYEQEVYRGQFTVENGWLKTNEESYNSEILVK